MSAAARPGRRPRAAAPCAGHRREPPRGHRLRGRAAAPASSAPRVVVQGFDPGAGRRHAPGRRRRDRGARRGGRRGRARGGRLRRSGRARRMRGGGAGRARRRSTSSSPTTPCRATRTSSSSTPPRSTRRWRSTCARRCCSCRPSRPRHDDARPGGRVVLLTSGQHLEPMAARAALRREQGRAAQPHGLARRPSGAARHPRQRGQPWPDGHRVGDPGADAPRAAPAAAGPLGDPGGRRPADRLARRRRGGLGHRPGDHVGRRLLAHARLNRRVLPTRPALRRS